MKVHVDRELRPEENTAGQKPPEQKTLQTPPCNIPLARAAYDWEHALEIATVRLWGDRAAVFRKEPGRNGQKT